MPAVLHATRTPTTMTTTAMTSSPQKAAERLIVNGAPAKHMDHRPSRVQRVARCFASSPDGNRTPTFDQVYRASSFPGEWTMGSTIAGAGNADSDASPRSSSR
jgi:hypothetical protein